MPPRGPAIVIGNHSSWLDPVWLGKMVPRRLIPMMTSVFYDIPGLRWFMKLGGAIRVQASTFRREVPELRRSGRRLDRGECLVIFPEGWMRRQGRDSLGGRSGQGISRILRERPQVRWGVLDRGWLGQLLLLQGGPPLKNKRIDFWRRIDVAMEDPQLLSPPCWPTTAPRAPTWCKPVCRRVAIWACRRTAWRTWRNLWRRRRRRTRRGRNRAHWQSIPHRSGSFRRRPRHDLQAVANLVQGMFSESRARCLRRPARD